MPARIDDALLLADLRGVAGKLRKRTITKTEHVEHGRYNVMTIVHRFGSWSKALKNSGLTPGHVMNVPVSDLLSDVRLVARRLGQQTLTKEKYDKHGRYASGTIARRCGSWTKALRAVGLEPAPAQEHRNVPLAHLLADVRRIARELGRRTLTMVEYDANGRYASMTIAKRIGSWTKALRAAGCETNKLQNIPTANLLADLRRVAKRIGKPTLTVEEYDTNGRYASVTIAQRIGSWTKALRAVGLEPAPAQEHRNVPLAHLLADLRRVAKRLGKPTLTTEEYDANGRYASVTVAMRIGSWINALLAAGIQPSWRQFQQSRSGLHSPLRTLSSIPGLTTEDRVKVAKTIDGASDLGDEVILQVLNRMNLGPMELPSGIPSGVPFWERCISALQRVQPDPEKLKATGVLERLGRQLHRAVAIEVLGREPLSPVEERRVAAELRRRKAA